MRKLLYSLYTLAIVVFFFSCKSDDNGVGDVEMNVAPSQVTNITAEVIINTAVVIISWDAATDADGDEVLYDITINEEEVQTKLSDTAIEVDVSQFLSISGKQSTIVKGLEVTLEIAIKAYDAENSFSTASVTRTLLINRQPSDFAFAEVIFDTDGYTQLDISWFPATDADGDTLVYTVYLNDIVLVENFEIPTGEEFGSFQYAENFLALSNAPLTVKVVVTDGSGETKEISQSFDFKATDVVLGALEATYNEDIQFNISELEADHRVGYKFSLEESTRYTIANNENVMMQLKNAQNTTLASGNTLEGVLEPGEYELILISNSLGQDLEGTFSLTIENLNLMAIPSSNVWEFRTEEDYVPQEGDIARYTFTINKPSGIFIPHNRRYLKLWLKNNEENIIAETFQSTIAIEEIPAGTYHLEIGDSFAGLGLLDRDIRFVLREATASDIDLGILSAPLNLTYEDLTGSFGEPDFERKFLFEIVDEGVEAQMFPFSEMCCGAGANLFNSNGEEVDIAPINYMGPIEVQRFTPLSPGKYTIVSFAGRSNGGALSDAESPGGVSFRLK